MNRAIPVADEDSVCSAQVRLSLQGQGRAQPGSRAGSIPGGPLPTSLVKNSMKPTG